MKLQVLLSVISIILIIALVIYKKYNFFVEKFEDDNDKYYNKILNSVNNFNYESSNKRLSLRVNNSKNIDNSNDSIVLPEEVIKVYNHILDSICKPNTKIVNVISRDYYNKNIGPQLYWLIIQSNNKYKEDVLVSLALIELTIFEGHKLKYNNGNIVLTEEVKSLLDSDKLEVNKEEFKKLLLNHVNNLFNEDYIVENYKKTESLRSNSELQAISKVVLSSINMIKDDSKNLCQRLRTYKDENKRNKFSLSSRISSTDKMIRSYNQGKKEEDNKNILDFGMDNNILLNNLLEKFKVFIKDEKLTEILFPMTELNFNKIRIIPLYTILSSIPEQDKKYYTALFAMIHYTVTTKDFTNLNNFMNRKPITINDKVKKSIRVDKNSLSFEETIDGFYNHYALVFKYLINKKA